MSGTTAIWPSLLRSCASTWGVTSLVPRRSLLAHTTWREISWRHRMVLRDLIRWRHDISHQVESSEREENAWVLGWGVATAFSIYVDHLRVDFSGCSSRALFSTISKSNVIETVKKWLQLVLSSTIPLILPPCWSKSNPWMSVVLRYKQNKVISTKTEKSPCSAPLNLFFLFPFGCST